MQRWIIGFCLAWGLAATLWAGEKMALLERPWRTYVWVEVAPGLSELQAFKAAEEAAKNFGYARKPQAGELGVVLVEKAESGKQRSERGLRRAEYLATLVAGKVKLVFKRGPGLWLQPKDMVLSGKGSAGKLIFDVFPYRPLAGERLGSFILATLSEIAEDLVAAKKPELSSLTVTVCEFPVRDEYGAGRWDSMKKIGAYKGTKSGKRWIFSAS